jgi:hypothetical protein
MLCYYVLVFHSACHFVSMASDHLYPLLPWRPFFVSLVTSERSTPHTHLNASQPPLSHRNTSTDSKYCFSSFFLFFLYVPRTLTAFVFFLFFSLLNNIDGCGILISFNLLSIINLKQKGLWFVLILITLLRSLVCVPFFPAVLDFFSLSFVTYTRVHRSFYEILLI